MAKTKKISNPFAFSPESTSEPSLDVSPDLCDPAYYLRHPLVIKLIAAAVDPRKLAIGNVSVRVRNLLSDAAPWITAHVYRYTDGFMMPSALLGLMYKIGDLVDRVDEKDVEKEWLAYKPDEADRHLHPVPSAPFVLPSKLDFSLDDIQATAAADANNSHFTDHQIRQFLAERLKYFQALEADSSPPRKKSRISASERDSSDDEVALADKVIKVEPKGPIPRAPARGSNNAYVLIPSRPDLPIDNPIRSGSSSRAHRSGSSCRPPANVLAPVAAPKSTATCSSTKPTLAKTTPKGKHRAPTPVSADEVEPVAAPVNDETDEPVVDEDSPDEYADRAAKYFNPYTSTMSKADFRELADHKADRSALEFMNSTVGHCIPRRKHNPRNEANVLTTWSNLPIPRIMFDAFEHATSYFTVVHPRFACTYCVTRDKCCLFRGYQAKCYNCVITNGSPCNFNLSERENEFQQEQLLPFVHLGPSETEQAVERCVSSRRRLDIQLSLAARAEAEYTCNFAYLAQHIVDVSQITSLDTLRARFTGVPADVDVLETLDLAVVAFHCKQVEARQNYLRPGLEAGERAMAVLDKATDESMDAPSPHSRASPHQPVSVAGSRPVSPAADAMDTSGGDASSLETADFSSGAAPAAS
ncbi:hypothetical protein C8J57DRAFT_1531451 [Mycena rebaudengoi]|nr:hypothetical protein C8J57DRAFT_1531451 [Mycena rebaudengoi]